MRICLIIINYNGYRFLVDYLEGLSEMCKRNAIDLIVTDDHSTDNSLDFLAQKGQEVTINTGRKGFAANVNNGIRYAQSKVDYDYYIIANNDITIKEGMFEIALPKALSKIISLDGRLGLIGFDEILEDREDYFNSFNFDLYSESSVISKNHIPGFFFIINKELLDVIGFLDEDYFMYGEDNDYFLRTLKAGFKIYNTALPVRHHSEGSSTNSRMISWYVYRNALLCARKNGNILDVLRVIISFVRIIYFPFYRNNHPSVLRVWRHGFFYNNFLLLKSILWNLKLFFNKK